MLMTLCAINSFEDELDCSILLEGGSEMLLELVAFDSDEVLGGATSELEETGAPSELLSILDSSQPSGGQYTPYRGCAASS